MSDINTGRPQDQRGIGIDDLEEKAIEQETITNDAVAGETVLPGVALQQDTGPDYIGMEHSATAPGEGPMDPVQPIYDEHDPQTEEPVELGDDEDDQQS